MEGSLGLKPLASPSRGSEVQLLLAIGTKGRWENTIKWYGD